MNATVPTPVTLLVIAVVVLMLLIVGRRIFPRM